MTLADRIIVMRDGHLEQVGQPIEVFQKPANAFVAGFIGTPPMNLVPARIITTDSGLNLDVEGKFKMPIPEKADATIKAEMDVIMGLRPEDLTIDNENGRIPEEWKVEGIVEVVEPLGSETHMHMDLYGLKFLAISEGRRIVNPGDKIILAMNLAHLHIFDAKTRLSIY